MHGITYDHELPVLLSKDVLILDTCILTLASKNPELRKLLETIKTSGCLFVTPSSVRVELLRGARNMRESSDLDLLFESLRIFTVENNDVVLTSPGGKKFMLIIQRSSAKNPSYVDLQLLQLAAFLSMQNRGINIMTSNFKDIPLELYDCKHTIAVSSSDGLQAIGIYAINKERLSKRFAELK